MKLFHLIPLISILAVAGCTHKQPKPPKMQESFATQIKPDGTKQFTYSLITEMPESKDSREHGHSGPGGHHDGPRGNHKRGDHNSKYDSMQDEFAQVFDEAMNTKLNTTNFCRTGFKKLDTQSRHGAMLLRGECNETANNTDREKFPNPAPQKIQVDVLE